MLWLQPRIFSPPPDPQARQSKQHPQIPLIHLLPMRDCQCWMGHLLQERQKAWTTKCTHILVSVCEKRGIPKGTTIQSLDHHQIFLGPMWADTKVSQEVDLEVLLRFKSWRVLLFIQMRFANLVLVRCILLIVVHISHVSSRWEAIDLFESKKKTLPFLLIWRKSHCPLSVLWHVRQGWTSYE